MKWICQIVPGYYWRDKEFPKRKWAEKYLKVCQNLTLLGLIEEAITSNGNACSELASEQDEWESRISFSVLIERLQAEMFPLIVIFDSYAEAKKVFRNLP